MRRILILKLGAVGDVIHSLPVLETLRSSFPEAHLGWVVEESAEALLKGNPNLDERILFERKRIRGPSGLRELSRWLRALKARRFDTVIDLHNLFKSGLIGYASGASLRIGFKKLREGNFLFMNRWVRPEIRHRHAVEKYLSLLSPLGLGPDQWKVRFRLVWENEEEERINRFLNERGLNGREVVAINAGANWPSKRWDPRRYAAVADALVEQRGTGVLILWGPGEKPLAQAVAGAMGREAVVACETSLTSLMPLLKRCRLLISGDTGPLHLAAALDVPTVALFGPSDPDRNGPYGKGHRVVRSSIPPAAHWRIKERGSRWMEDIRVGAVVEAAFSLLKDVRGKE